MQCTITKIHNQTANTKLKITKSKSNHHKIQSNQPNTKQHTNIIEQESTNFKYTSNNHTTRKQTIK